MKTNIKIRVTPEQSKRVQEICFKNNIAWHGVKAFNHSIRPYIYVYENTLGYDCKESRKYFNDHANIEIDADLFIRTDGTCEEDKYRMIDTIIHTPYNVPILEKKLKKKNEILKKARIKRKNQREELHKLNLKLQKCISLEEHRKVLDWHIERNESLFAEIDNLKAENKSLKESSKISCNMLHNQKDKIDRLELNYVIEQSNYKKEIEKLKAVIEYLESKAK